MTARPVALKLGCARDSGCFALAFVCVAAVLASIGVSAARASGQGADDRTDTGYRVISDYDTLHEAESRVHAIVQAGGSARVREEARHIRLFNLRLGIYASRRQARRARRHLKNRKIDSQLLGDAADGYSLSVGAFSERSNAALLRSRLEVMGFDNTYVTPITIVKKHYVVERKVMHRVDSVSVSVEDGPQSSVSGDGVIATADGPYDGGTAKPPSTAVGTLRNRLPAYVHFGAGMDTMRMETGWLADMKEPVTGSHYLRASAHTDVKLGYRWEFRLAGRVDGYYQQGNPSVNRTQLDYAPSYIRYDGLNTRVTVGAQRVIWGRMDSFPPNDRLSVQDISRFILYRMSWRRRSVPEVRVEQYFGSGFKADLLWQPWFRPAKLPAPDSIWYPVDKRRGRIISVRSNAVFSQLVKEGKFAKDDGGAGGIGLRFSGTAKSVDYAVSIQRARRSLPYYRFDPTVRDALLGGASVGSAIAASPQTFTEVHPWSWYIGSDAAIDAFSATWRLEAAYVSDIPVTTTDFLYTKKPGIDWGAEVEFYPGDANTRVNLQLSGTELFNPPAVLDRINIYSFGGMVERPFLHGRWHARLRFLLGLDKKNVYVNPELAYTAWDPYEIYIDAHYFAGDSVTSGGYHQDHSLITVGWRARY